MELNVKKIFRSGRMGLVLILNKEFKKLGLGIGDTVHVFLDKDKIIISKKSEPEILRPPGVSEETWTEFMNYIIRKRSGNLSEEISKEIDEALKNWVEEKTLKITFFGKTIYEKSD